MKEEKHPLLSSSNIFWAEIAPCDHVLQIYEKDELFIDSLERFVSDGFEKGEAVILIATPEHLSQLRERIKSNYDLTELHEKNQFFSLNAEECLSHFMVNDWPDESLFNIFLSSLLQLAQRDNRKVRAFGEMVALLWANGLSGATVQLEHLWNRFMAEEKFSLFCAYPKTGFTADMIDSIQHICKQHHKIILKTNPESGEISYHKTPRQGIFGRL